MRKLISLSLIAFILFGSTYFSNADSVKLVKSDNIVNQEDRPPDCALETDDSNTAIIERI